MQYTIFCVKDRPAYADRAADWFSSKWQIPKEEYRRSIADMCNRDASLPRWYLAVDAGGEITGGCGLIQNDFVDRTDLFPYLCALFVEPDHRGHALGGALLAYARKDAAKQGFARLYLCTDHTAYYERYGWRYIAAGTYSDGHPARIYQADSIAEDPSGRPAAGFGAPEPMATFFTQRVERYDEHMRREVEGGAQGYRRMAESLPAGVKNLLDLGCGTGLELEEIFRRFPSLAVTGIDLTPAMLQRLRRKFPDRRLTLCQGDYFQVVFGTDVYDAAVAYQTLHHFTPAQKLSLYRRLYGALKPGGVYLECDYMADTTRQEQYFFNESARLRERYGLTSGQMFHYDTPCTPAHQIRLLRQAGFVRVAPLWRAGSTVLLRAVRPGKSVDSDGPQAYTEHSLSERKRR